MNSTNINLNIFFKRLKFTLLNKSYYKYLLNLRSIDSNSYTLKSFDKTKSIFIHIPKCGGTSILKSIYGNLGGGHITFDKYSTIYSRKEIESYFKFTAIRNPWDRVVSAYHYLALGAKTDEDKKWFDENISKYGDFKSFIKGWLKKENIFKYYHFQPQYYYILNSHKKLKINYFIFFENLENDLRNIYDLIGEKSKIEHLNKSNHHDYKQYYDEETKLIVSSVYEEDIRLLGYNFDNSSLTKQKKDRDSQKLSYPYYDK